VKNSDYKNLSRYVSSYLGGLKTHSVAINDQEWRYIEGGEGETIIFLHGLGGSKLLWRSLMQSYVSKYRVIAVDVPGLCIDQRLDNRKHTYRELANWLELLLKHMRIDRFHLVAHSSACSIASCFASTRPSQVASIALLNHQDVLVESRGAQVRGVLETYLDPAVLETSEGWDKTFSSLFYSAPSVPRIIQRHRQRTMLAHREDLKRVVEELAELRPMAMSYLRKLKCPTLSITSTHDVFAPLEFQNSLKNQMPCAQHVLLDKCGHASFIEKSDEVLNILQDFFESAKHDSSEKRFAMEL